MAQEANQLLISSISLWEIAMLYSKKLKAGANINAKNKHVGTPLRRAVSKSQVDVAAYLLSQGANKTIISEDEYDYYNNLPPYEMAEYRYKEDPTDKKAKMLVDMLKN